MLEQLGSDSDSKKGKRFAEPKYFIMGYSRESDLPSTTLIEIDKIATEFESNFNDLSEFGKYGANVIDVERTYRKSISLTKQALMLRKIWYKPSP